jgi:multiple antibiotic resistance protein
MGDGMIGIGEIVILFFVTLGPLKLLGPFAQQTHDLHPAVLRAIAVRAFAIGLAAVVVGGYLGKLLAAKWQISEPAILIATGIIFFLVALGLVMAPYQPAHAAPPPLPPSPLAASLRLTFPLVVTPYGIAALIALLSIVEDPATTAEIYAVLVVVMVLNLLSMLYVRQIMRGPVLLVLQVLGAVLGVLQVGLAVQIIIRGLKGLHVLST